MEALNANNPMSVDDLNMSQETVELNVSVIEPHDSENYVNQTPIRKRKRGGMASYCESDSSWEDIGSDEEYKLDDDDDDDEDIPLRKKPRRFKSTPKNDSKLNKSGGSGRKAGRPPGSKNKPKNGQKNPSSAAGGHNIKKKKSKSQLNKETLQLNKETLQISNVDDNENVVAIVGQNEVDLNDSTLNPETSCGSPVKTNPRKESRKKLRRPHTWYKNKKKADKNSGVEYISKTSKNEMQIRRAKRVGPPCTCRQKCYVKVGEQNVQNLFKGYYELPTYNCKNQYLSQLITKIETKNQRLYGSENKSRVSHIFHYHVIVDGNKMKVCKTAFCNIFDIGKEKVEVVIKKTNSNGIVEPDRRGKHPHHNQVPEEMKEKANEHIMQMPVKKTHYTINSNPHKQYIDTPNRETHKWLYAKYREWLADNDPEVPPVKCSYYLEIYNTKFNLEIKPPKIDTCDTCHKLEQSIIKGNAEGKDTNELQKECDNHKEKANEAYDHLRQARDKKVWNPKEWLVLCMDLQQAHVIPKTNIGSNYYHSKANMYNFCIADVREKIPKCTFYVWEEYNGKKGSAEIYSCVYKYLQENVLHLNKEKRPKKLRIIADNCGGQNKSNTLVLALLRLVHLQEFDRIELAFLVPGHTYMPCDRKFGSVSRHLKRIDSISTPDALIHHLKHAEQDPLNVQRLEKKEIYNINVLTRKGVEKRCALIRRHGNSFQKASVIVMRKAWPNGYILKESFKIMDEDKEAVKINVNLPTAKQNLNLGRIQLQPKYPTQIKLKKNKMDGLQKVRLTLGDQGRWIDDLFAEQAYARDYKDDEEDLSLFPEETQGVDNILEDYEPVARIPSES